MGSTAFLTPNWKFIIFLTAVYVLTGAYLVSLPTTFPLTGLDINALITAISVGAGAAVAAALLSGLVSDAAGKWAAIGAFFLVMVGSVFFLGVIQPFILLGQVVSFSGLGLPVIIQLALAIPCFIIFAWQVLAFIAAFTGLASTGD